MRILCFVLGVLALLGSGGLLAAIVITAADGPTATQLMQASLILGVGGVAWMVGAVAFAPRDRPTGAHGGGYR